MNTPNKLTILRVCLIPLFVVLMLWQGGDWLRWAALVIFVGACLTDLLDGYLARKNNQVTNFGKFMDPLADKLLVCSALICFVATGRVQAWIVIVIISREFIISGFRLLALESGIVLAASFWGKLKTTVQMTMTIVLIAGLPWDFMRIVEQILIYAAALLTVVSLIDYLYKNRQVLRTNH